MSIKDDVKGLTFKRYSKEIYGIVICDCCDNLAIGVYFDENDKQMLIAIDVCEEHYKESIKIPTWKGNL